MRFSRCVPLCAALLAGTMAGCGGGSSTDTVVKNPQSTGIGGVTARAYADVSVSQSGSDEAARVEVTWIPTSDISASNIVNYLIFRDGFLLDAVPSQTSSYMDRADAAGNFSYSIPANVTLANPLPGTPSANPLAGIPAEPSATLTTVLNVPRTPLPVGSSHHYSVAVVYRERKTSSLGTSSNAFVYRLTGLASESGVVTPLQRPTMREINFGSTSSAAFTQIQVIFTTVLGANEYVLEFADNSAFTDKKSTLPFFAEGQNGQITIYPTPVDLTALFPGLKGRVGTRIFYRVGARNSNDKPGVLARDTPNGGEYIYSAPPASFEIFPSPPPSP